MFNKFSNYKGFTLAEVLVTLAIIGVVAALTIPTLINSTSDQGLLKAVKKEYSVLAQATMRLQNGDGINTTDASTIRTSYATVISFVKSAPQNQIFPASYSMYKNTAVSDNWTLNTYPSVILSDGSIWRFLSNSSNCTATYPTAITGICGGVDIDVNGLKPPNMYGKDMFFFRLLKLNGVYVVRPHGGTGDNRVCANPSTGTGNSSGCTFKAIMAGSSSDMP
jgi:prepilin-type N-terminal cleavage/methylation domain-containing protein